MRQMFKALSSILRSEERSAIVYCTHGAVMIMVSFFSVILLIAAAILGLPALPVFTESFVGLSLIFSTPFVPLSFYWAAKWEGQPGYVAGRGDKFEVFCVTLGASTLSALTLSVVWTVLTAITLTLSRLMEVEMYVNVKEAFFGTLFPLTLTFGVIGALYGGYRAYRHESSRQQVIFD